MKFYPYEKGAEKGLAILKEGGRKKFTPFKGANHKSYPVSRGPQKVSACDFPIL